MNYLRPNLSYAVLNPLYSGTQASLCKSLDVGSIARIWC